VASRRKRWLTGKQRVLRVTYSEDELLPLSGLQHLAFCERQCALIHIEGAWSDNRLTTLGSLQHARNDEPDVERRQGVVICRGMALRSLRLGVAGTADVVEFHPGCPEASSRTNAALTPFPVEHKHGRPKPDLCDEVQICAQAMCLEEMLDTSVPEGAIFYGQPRRRHQVRIGPDLRLETERIALRFHEMVACAVTPMATYCCKKCRSCSLLDLCVPRRRDTPRSARRYVATMISEALSHPVQLDGSS
jgi:CRISPR-associated exonuclease Cas4